MAAAPESEWLGLVKHRGQIQPTGWLRVFPLGGGAETVRNIGTGHGRGAIAVERDAAWVTNGRSQTVTRLDRNCEPTAIAKLRKHPVAIAVGPQGTWVLCGNGWLWRVSPAAERTEGVARLGPRARAVAATDTWVWVLREPGELIRLEPTTGEVTLQTSVGRGARHLIAAGGTLWATRRRGRWLLRIDGDSGEIVEESKAPRQVVCLTAAGENLWVGCRRRTAAKRGWLYRGDPAGLGWEEAETLAGRPRAIASGQNAIWIASAPRGEREGTIERFDPATGRLETFATTDWPVHDLAVFGDSLLATMGFAISTGFDAGGGPFDLGVGGIGGEGGGGGDGGGGN